MQARVTCAKSCCPTAVICKKKTRSLPTAMDFPNMIRPCPVRAGCAGLPAADQRCSEVGKRYQPIPGWFITLSNAGHILGANSVLLEVADRRILFSGDLGRPDDTLMKEPDRLPMADTVLVESTYGNRSHPADNLSDELAPALQRLAGRGVAVVPVFAVGRAQALLHAIAQLKHEGPSPNTCPCSWTAPWPCTPPICSSTTWANTGSASMRFTK